MSPPLGRLIAAMGAGSMLGLALLARAAGPLGPVAAAPRDEPTPVPTATPDSEGWQRLPAHFADYAPSGLPDFDQRQTSWRVTSPFRQSWTHDGPVALASALWWLDSRHEPDPMSPAEPHDGFDLVQALGPWDDHDPDNVLPLTNAVATMARTNGPQGLMITGTCMDDLAGAANRILAGSTERQRYVGQIVELPRLYQLQAMMGAGRPAVLLLGIWQFHELVGWQRLGGHYVALEAIDASIGRARVADPFLDIASPAGQHSDHNDAALVSHDSYVLAPSLRPGPVLRLNGYIEGSGDVTALVANFQGLNGRSCNEGDTAWLDGAVLEAHIDAALTFAPVIPPTETPTPTPTDTPTPTEPPTSTPSATATIAATDAFTATVTATEEATLAPTEPATSTATELPTLAPSETATATATDLPTASPSPSATASPTETTAPPPSATATPAASTTASPALTDLCGHVTEAGSGSGVEGATVSLVRAGQLVRTVQTGAGGAYCLAGLSPGNYLLRVRRAGCEPVERPIELGSEAEPVNVALSCHVQEVYLPMLVVQRSRGRTR